MYVGPVLGEEEENRPNLSHLQVREDVQGRGNHISKYRIHFRQLVRMHLEHHRASH